MSFTDFWDANPQDGNWNNPNNWSTGTVPVPNGSQDGGAFFYASSITALTIEYVWLPPPITIEAGAPAYSFNLTGSFTDSYSIGNDSSNLLSISLTSAPLAILELSGAIFGAVSFTTDSSSQLDFEDYNYSSQTDDGVIITTNGLVYFNGNATAGSAQLITNAGGVVDFSGSTGEAGDHQVSAGSIEGAGTYDLGSNQLTVGSDGLSTEVSGSVNDGGAYGGSGASLVLDGTGTLTLTGSNSYTGGTTVDGGTLQLGDGGTSGSILGNVTDNATFAIDLADTYTFSGTITGTGSFQQTGIGTTIFTAADSYAGGTTITTGALQLGDGTTDGSITGDITDNASLVADDTGTLTLSGTISGTGSFQQLGAGTTILTAGESYVGGTTISAGTLQLDDGGASASIAGSVTDDGTFAIDRSDTFTFGGTISGSGAFQQLGTGTTILTAASDSFTGTTTISAGTLQLDDGGTSGSITGNVTDNANFAIDRSDIYTFGGAISGTGAFQQIGTGTTILAAASDSFTGTTTISAGTLQLDDGGTSGSITGNVTDNANFAIDRSDTYTFGGSISGTGAFQQIGSGTTIITASDSYTGGTTVTNGTLELGNGGGLAGGGALTIDGGTFALNGHSQSVGDFSGTGGAVTLGGGVLTVGGADSTSFSGAISGSGSLVKAGSGTLTLLGSNSDGGTLIEDGTLQLGNGGTSGALTGDAFDDGVLAVDRSDTITLAGTISGTGAFDQISGGTTIVTAADTYSGGTTIDAGTLELGSDGSIAGGGNVTFTGASATLQLDTAVSQIAGDIAGAVAGDDIDLRFQSFASGDQAVWQQNGGIGTLLLETSDDVTLQTLTLAGTYTSTDFSAVSDNNGGTSIEVVTPPAIPPTNVWTQIDNGSPAAMTGGDFENTGTAQIAASYSGYGTYIYASGTGWTKIDNGVPTVMTSGDFAGLGYPQLAGVFAGSGTYTYTLNVGWTKIDNGTPTLLTSSDYRGLGYAQLAGVFTGYGTYTWSNSTGWIKIDNGNPTLLTSGDFLGSSDGNNNLADLAGYFPGYGTYIRAQSTGWTKIDGGAPSAYAAGNFLGTSDGNNNQTDLAAYFPGSGTYIWSENAGWTNIELAPARG